MSTFARVKRLKNCARTKSSSVGDVSAGERSYLASERFQMNKLYSVVNKTFLSDYDPAT